MRLFICAPEEYHEDTDELAALLEKNGHIVYYSYRDTPRDIPHEEIFLNNLILIRNADIFISHFTRDGLYTIDLAVELGIAAETMKPILGLIEVDSEQAADDDFDLSSLDDVDEISTKLDLARAYLDMGDHEGTRGILEEVIAEGNDEQKKEAADLMAKLD